MGAAQWGFPHLLWEISLCWNFSGLVYITWAYRGHWVSMYWNITKSPKTINSFCANLKHLRKHWICLRHLKKQQMEACEDGHDYNNKGRCWGWGGWGPSCQREEEELVTLRNGGEICSLVIRPLNLLKASSPFLQKYCMRVFVSCSLFCNKSSIPFIIWLQHF